MKTYLIVPDIHVPFHDRKFTKLVTKIIKHIDPDGLVQLGDALDAFQISTYSKCPSRRNLLAEDIDDYKLILNEWSRELKQNAAIHLLEGNHESRLSRYIAGHCRDLHGLVPDWQTLLGIQIRNQVGKHRWHFHPYHKWNSCKIGDCILMHGFYFNQHVAATCLAKYRTNIVFGHTHRLQFIHDGTHWACSLGHGSDESDTAHQPTPTGWKQCLGLLHVDHKGKTKLDVIEVNDGKAVVYGETISS